MNKTQTLIVCAFSLIFSGTAFADTPPKKTLAFKKNYETLTQDRKVSPRIATCIAGGYDLINSDKKLDRLGFTDAGISNVKIKKSKAKQQDMIIQGQARDRKSGQWRDIILNCTLQNDNIKRISIKNAK